MTDYNPIQFAVVREDPMIDMEIIENFKLQNILLIASGGCTALSIAAKFQDRKLTLFDPNPNQLLLVKEKFKILSEITDQRGFENQFNIAVDIPGSLNAKGNFESLFRNFRKFIWEFICPESGWIELFNGRNTLNLSEIFSNKYWNVAFELFFHDSLLLAMFGPDALQHAPKGSYPSYFRERLEQGLKRQDLEKNYFLHHIFLGYYLTEKESQPFYLQQKILVSEIEYINGYLQDVPYLEEYDYIMLSNIFDWMSQNDIDSVISLLKKKCKKDSVICFRQLNNTHDLASEFQDQFQLQKELSENLYQKDRSLFYNSLSVLRKVVG